MRRYNPKVICEKCGGKDIHTAYHKDKEYGCPKELSFGDEHLCRYCRRCGFKWPEKTLKKKPQ